VLNLSTSLYAATSSTITTSFCQGSYYLLNGQYYFNAGNFTQQLLNSNGCDSTININLTMIANPPTTKVDSFCQGGVYHIGQYTLSFPSNYYLNLGQNHIGCDSIVSLTLTIKVNKPTILGGKDTVICAGQPCKLTATGGVNYSWSGGFNNGQTFYPSATTWYVVTGYGTNGCSDIDSVKVTVALSPTNPTITNTAGVLSSSAAANNHWYVNGNALSGATSNSYTPTTAGAYKVCVINAAGCKACSNTLNIVFQSIEELNANKQEIYAYPVPFNEELIVAASSNNYCAKCRLMVFNSLGQKVTSAEFNSKELNLPTSNWANGVYLLQVVNSENQMIGQLQVVK
jgi:hypothetical protein